MNTTFNSWPSMVVNQPLDVVANFILTNRKAIEFIPDKWIFETMGSPNDKLKVLDFGCGIGRNTFGMAEYSPNWEIIGYDHPTVLSRTEEFYFIKYKKYTTPENAQFVDDWESLKQTRFDWILCTLVLQHIHEKDLITYVSDFKNMTTNIVINSRRFNDDDNKNTWEILERNGLFPYKCIGWNNGVHGPMTYTTYGESEEHLTCFYKL